MSNLGSVRYMALLTLLVNLLVPVESRRCEDTRDLSWCRAQLRWDKCGYQHIQRQCCLTCGQTDTYQEEVVPVQSQSCRDVIPTAECERLQDNGYIDQEPVDCCATRTNRERFGPSRTQRPSHRQPQYHHQQHASEPPSHSRTQRPSPHQPQYQHRQHTSDHRREPSTPSSSHQSFSGAVNSGSVTKTWIKNTKYDNPWFDPSLDNKTVTLSRNGVVTFGKLEPHHANHNLKLLGSFTEPQGLDFQAGNNTFNWKANLLTLAFYDNGAAQADGSIYSPNENFTEVFNLYPGNAIYLVLWHSQKHQLYAYVKFDPPSISRRGLKSVLQSKQEKLDDDAGIEAGKIEK